MSWKGVKKAVDRASTTLMQKAGAIERTVDKDFDDEERRFRNLEAKADKLYKEAKGYLDSVRAMTIAQQRIAETINQFYDESSPFADLGQKYKDTASRMDEQVRTAVDADYRASVLDPLSRFHEFFPAVNEVIKKRQKKLLDYDSYRSKVRKLAEKPADDIDRLPKAERQTNEARELYAAVNQQLIDDLPKLVDLRVPFLDPSFEALIKCQIKFSSDAYHQLSDLRKHFEAHSGTGHGSLDGRVEQVLQQLRDLTIVGHAGAATAS